MFTPAQLLRNWGEELPRSQGDPCWIFTGRLRESVHGDGLASDVIFVLKNMVVGWRLKWYAISNFDGCRE
jgi:hypothetical protein